MTDITKTIYHLNREQEEHHTRELANKLNLPYINLTSYPITKEVIDAIPENLAIQFRVIPYLKLGRSVRVGVVHPADPATMDFLKRHSQTVGVEFVISVISQTSFLYGITFYETLKREAAKMQDNSDVAPKEEDFDINISDLGSVGIAAKKVSVTQLLDVIIIGALKTKASDIHLEPEEKEFLVRYRVDGVLQDVVKLPLPRYKQLISRIKYLAKLRMDIASQPQDGRFSVKELDNETIDLRISIMPSSFGESIVIRILGQAKSILALDKLGFRDEALAAIREAISKPHGMILTSGPTGSGKSSTLYAILMALNKPGIKIITLEDPVEYRIEGIEQSQVDNAAGYKFADGLRASLRQDPDVLMVGEIRDVETAEIAVQAALTGHLLVSTIHANSAPAVFARLLEMGVKPYLLSGSINLVMAQRLVRKVCANCREQYAPRPEIWQEVKRLMEPIKKRLSPDVIKLLDSAAPLLHRGKGCDKCTKSGYSGREVVIEVLVPDSSIEGLLAKTASITEFERAAVAQGIVTMEQDGLIKALKGETTVEEVWRVTKS